MAVGYERRLRSITRRRQTQGATPEFHHRDQSAGVVTSTRIAGLGSKVARLAAIRPPSSTVSRSVTGIRSCRPPMVARSSISTTTTSPSIHQLWTSPRRSGINSRRRPHSSSKAARPRLSGSNGWRSSTSSDSNSSRHVDGDFSSLRRNAPPSARRCSCPPRFHLHLFDDGKEITQSFPVGAIRL